jgi:hypothetical protein
MGAGAGAFKGQWDLRRNRENSHPPNAWIPEELGAQEGIPVPDMVAEIPGRLTDNWLPAYPSIARQVIKMPVMRGHASITP